MSLRRKLSRISSVGPPSPSERGESAEAAGGDGAPSAPPAPPEAHAPLADAPSSTAARLDALRSQMRAVLERTARKEAPPSLPPVAWDDLSFGAEPTETGPLYVRTRRLPLGHRIGRAPTWSARSASSELLALLALDPRLAGLDVRRALYLDTETTGLHGGTGTVAFLVGLAFFDGDALVVEQLLVRNLGEEAPMLARVASRMAASSMLVTFNGKSFDVPLLRTRFVLARVAPPVEPPHLDLLHVARRVHAARGAACRLVRIERDVLGFERVDDVPSGEVSACYLHFLRTGDGRALLGVVEHNAWDVMAMAALVGLYGEPLEGTQLAGDDLAGVARTLKRAGRPDEAYAVAHRAVAEGGTDASLRARADLAKARGDRTQALADFEALASRVDDAAVRLELAKLYEHFVREPSRALAVVARGVAEGPERASRRARRLERKVEDAARQADAASRQGALPGVAVGGSDGAASAREKRRR